MKIRAITLRNVRRFAGQTASLSGIADGVTTICEPNETGKSTFFDALHALLFVDHKANTEELRALQPYSKGSVEVAADIETEEGHFRIEKKFLSSRSATVTDLGAGAIVAQEGEAEAWIKKAIGADLAGPAGLLWVRQGVSGFGPDGSGQKEKRERDRLRDARQSLMSTVAGQIDSVTGGRRMDSIMKAVATDLDALATKNLSPKASGEWGKATKLVEELTTQKGQLEAQVNALSQALRRRTELKRKLDDPKASEVDSGRRAEIERLDGELQKAHQHDKQVADAARDLTLAELKLKSIEERIAERGRQAARRQRHADEAKKAADAIAAIGASATSTQAAFTETEALHASAADVLRRARAAERRAIRAREAASSGRRRDEIAKLLKRVADVESDLKAARKVLKANPLTSAGLADLESLSRDIAQAETRRDAGATTLAMTYCGPARATIAGVEIGGDRSVPVHVATDIDLPGIGSMTITPAVGAKDDADIGALRAGLEEQFGAAGCADLVNAREMARTHAKAKGEETAALAALRALVPEGTDELRRTIEELSKTTAPEEAPEDDRDLPSVPEAEAAEEDAGHALRQARDARDRAANALLEARTTLRLAQEALGQFDDEAQSETSEDLDGPRAGALGEVETARKRHADLTATAFAVDDIRANRDRLVSVRQAAQESRNQARQALGQLDGEIGARADDGVEARLEEVRGELEQAEARAARYAFEVATLSALRDELEKARSEARDAYFEPVKRELVPLIALLHEGAELEMDPDTMLPARIRRGAVVDEFDVLSGGAAEQIAILTRLAFARLYARQGRQVPVILDDALVHSDDDRIIRMFTALTKISRDQQIIVFSCRSRAFEELGGRRPQIEIA